MSISTIRSLVGRAIPLPLHPLVRRVERGSLRPLGRMPKNFSLVICDGPPGTTRGGRYGLLPVMQAYLSDDCTILLDDAGRHGERQIVARWAKELGTVYRIEGTNKPYAVIEPLSPSFAP